MRKNGAVDELLSCPFVTPFLQVGQIFGTETCVFSSAAKKVSGKVKTVRRKVITVLLLFEGS